MELYNLITEFAHTDDRFSHEVGSYLEFYSGNLFFKVDEYGPSPKVKVYVGGYVVYEASPDKVLTYITGDWEAAVEQLAAEQKKTLEARQSQIAEDTEASVDLNLSRQQRRESLNAPQILVNEGVVQDADVNQSDVSQVAIPTEADIPVVILADEVTGNVSEGI